MNAETWYAEGNFFSYQGKEIFFKRQGSGKPLLCIHGFPTSSLDFYKLWPVLTSSYDCVCSDLIGLGKSDKSLKKMDVMTQADAIEELLQDQGVNQTHILAHDLGDTVAQELLARQISGEHKITILSCVFLNGGIFPDGHRPRLIQKLLISRIGPLVAQLSSKGTFKRNMRNICSKQNPLSDAFLNDAWELLISNGGRSALPKLIQYMKERVTYRERWLSALQKAPVPLRLINGILDPISGKQMVDYYRTYIPEPDIVEIDVAGHYPHIEVSDKVLKAYFEFRSS